MKYLIFALLLQAYSSQVTYGECNRLVVNLGSYDCITGEDQNKLTDIVENGWNYFAVFDERRNRKMVRIKVLSDPTVMEKIEKSKKLIESVPKVNIFLPVVKSMTVDKYYMELINFEFILTNRNYLVHSSSFGEQIIVDKIWEIGFSLNEFESKKIVITEAGVKGLVLSDFEDSFYFSGLEDAVKVGDPISDAGDFHYWEPERLAGNVRTFEPAADAYAFGVKLWKIIHKDEGDPFPGTTKEEVFNRQIKAIIQFLKTFQ